jgi:hypothetical protein
VDESVDGEGVTFLRDRGWNAKGVHEVGLAGSVYTATPCSPSFRAVASSVRALARGET